MKLCKRCKKKVANKTKICPNCGYDVSKAKIIVNSVKKKTIPVIENKDLVVKQELDEEKPVVKTPAKKKNKYEKMLQNQKKIPTKNKNKKKKKSTPSNSIEVKKEEKPKKFLSIGFLNKGKKEPKKEIKKESKHESKQEQKQEVVVEQEVKPKKIKIPSSGDNSKTKQILINFKNKITEEVDDSDFIDEEPKKSNKYLTIGLISFVILAFLVTGSFIIYYVVKDIDSNKSIDITTENLGEIYDMNERVSYNGLDYIVTDAEVIEGSDFKKPKDGYEFVLVTISINNNSSDKAKYNYKQFRMNNSKNEESSRIFTPVNADTALYSGNIVVGASKSGTLVFEQPIGDEELMLKFYENEYIEKTTTDDKDTTDENSLLNNDENKVIFQVRIKVK